jgi:hypothetical protein
MRLKAVALILFSVALIGVGLTLIYYNGYHLKEYREIPYDFIVREGAAGFDVGTDAMHFGALPPGTSGSRRLIITPSANVHLVIAFSGNGSEHLFAAPNNIDLATGEQVQVNFTATIPDDTKQGNYAGIVKMYLYRR